MIASTISRTVNGALMPKLVVRGISEFGRLSPIRFIPAISCQFSSARCSQRVDSPRGKEGPRQDFDEEEGGDHAAAQIRPCAGAVLEGSNGLLLGKCWNLIGMA